jgi:hypothetical protein
LLDKDILPESFGALKLSQLNVPDEHDWLMDLYVHAKTNICMHSLHLLCGFVYFRVSA